VTSLTLDIGRHIWWPSKLSHPERQSGGTTALTPPERQSGETTALTPPQGEAVTDAT
jgi:hypothetical protein